MQNQKIFVLDTNIPLESARAYLDFEDNYVFVSSVIRSEMDHFKGRMDDVGFNARLFLDDMEKFSREYNVIRDGVPINNGRGRLFETFEYKNKRGKDPLIYMADIGKNDLDIIRAALVLKEHNPDTLVELVSHDKNVLNIARYNGLNARFRTKGEVKIEQIPKGIQTIANDDIVAHIYSKIGSSKSAKGKIELDYDFLLKHGIALDKCPNNQYFVFKSDEDGIKNKTDYKMVFRYDIKQNSLLPLGINPYKPIGGVRPRNLEQTVLMDAVMLETNYVIAAYGPAGTGKTLCMLACALQLIHKRRTEEGDSDAVLYLTKPAINVAGEAYGFLPGDITAKTSINYRGINKNLKKIMNWWKATSYDKSGNMRINPNEKMKESWGDNIEKLQESEIAEVYPLGYIRGDTIMPNEILIVDEPQNTIPPVMKTIVTRGEEGCKILLCGDPWQIDNPLCRTEYNGLTHFVDTVSRRHDKKYNFNAAVQLQKSERGPVAEFGDLYL